MFLLQKFSNNVTPLNYYFVCPLRVNNKFWIFIHAYARACSKLLDCHACAWTGAVIIFVTTKRRYWLLLHYKKLFIAIIPVTARVMPTCYYYFIMYAARLYAFDAFFSFNKNMALFLQVITISEALLRSIKILFCAHSRVFINFLYFFTAARSRTFNYKLRNTSPAALFRIKNFAPLPATLAHVSATTWLWSWRVFSNYTRPLTYNILYLFIYYHALLQNSLITSTALLQNQFLITPRAVQNFIFVKQRHQFQIHLPPLRCCKNFLYNKFSHNYIRNLPNATYLSILARILKYKIRNLELIHFKFYTCSQFLLQRAWVKYKLSAPRTKTNVLLQMCGLLLHVFYYKYLHAAESEAGKTIKNSEPATKKTKEQEIIINYSNRRLLVDINLIQTYFLTLSARRVRARGIQSACGARARDFTLLAGITTRTARWQSYFKFNNCVGACLDFDLFSPPVAAPTVDTAATLCADDAATADPAPTRDTAALAATPAATNSEKFIAAAQTTSSESVATLLQASRLYYSTTHAFYKMTYFPIAYNSEARYSFEFDWHACCGFYLNRNFAAFSTIFLQLIQLAPSALQLNWKYIHINVSSLNRIPQ